MSAASIKDGPCASYRKDYIIQKQNLVKRNALFIQVNQILQRLIPQLGQIGYPPQLLLAPRRLDPASLVLVPIFNLILVRDVGNVDSVRHAAALELVRQVPQQVFAVIPAPALAHADKDIVGAKQVRQLEDGGVPVAPQNITIVKVHAGNVDALLGSTRLARDVLALAGEVVVDAHYVKDVEEDKDDEEDPYGFFTAEAPQKQRCSNGEEHGYYRCPGAFPELVIWLRDAVVASNVVSRVRRLGRHAIWWAGVTGDIRSR